MGHEGLSGLRPHGTREDNGVVACVLSGGGPRASFQLGALAYLYENDPEFDPTVFVGTSAGSVLASVIGQGGTREEQRAYHKELLEIWLGMDSKESMFIPRPWLARAMADMPNWLNLVEQSQDPAARKPPPSTPAERSSFAARFPFLKRSSAPASATSATPPESQPTPAPPPPPAPEPEPSQPVDPVQLALTPDPETHVSWSLNDMFHLVGHVGKLPRLGTDLSAIRHGMEQTRSMYRHGPVLARLVDPAVFSPERIVASGTKVRLAMVGLETGQVRFIHEDGTLSDRHGNIIDEEPLDFTAGILASCAIPGAFRPVPLGNQTYVDGGVKENFPVERAVHEFKPAKLYAITSVAPLSETPQTMHDVDLINLVMRTVDLLTEEINRDELAYAHSVGATVISPKIAVHDGMTIHPGLTRINVDYGWMRAAETILGLGAEQEEITQRIAELRIQALGEEEALVNDEGITLDDLAATKFALRDAVAASDPRVLPPEADHWWRRFEQHVDQRSFEEHWMEHIED